MDKRKLAIITYGGWFNTFQRPHHLARYLGKQYETCVINNTIRLPFRGYGYMAEQADLVDGLLNIYLLKEDERFPFLKGINRVLARCQNHFVFRSRELGESEIVYTWHIEDTSYLERCRDKFLVYDAMDDWAAFSETIEQRLIDNENEVVARADLVLAVSRKLYDRHSRLNKNTLLVPNGVDDTFFRTALTYAKQESDILNEYRDRPVVGYVGGIHDWVDVDLIAETARRLPEVVFVLIGPTLKSLKPKLEGIPNLLSLGPKPYSELISYMAYFTVGIIPFKLNLLNESTNPIKLYEYLGAGLPVVSTGMQEVVAYEADGVVYIADNPETFSERISEALAAAGDPGKIDERLGIAAVNSWAARAEQIMSGIETGLNARRNGNHGS
ncbi:MAG: glycosyltransferase [Geobacteraceae bacterium]|nr:glycosyltransferase [Geobacteraceae bacterium]